MAGCTAHPQHIHDDRLKERSLNEPKPRGRPAKPSRTLDDEIAETEARLQALREKQQEEKARRERDANRGKILAFIQAEGLDAAAPEQWQAVLPKLRQLLKLEAPAHKDAEPAEASGDQAQA
jgi:hypothetical protein